MANKPGVCTNCSRPFVYCDAKTRGKFCCSKCNGEWQQRQASERIIRGDGATTKTLRSHLLRAAPKCVECGIGPEWNGKPLALQMDHIDGNSDNNLPSNLRLLCPNCHAQTETWRGRNKKPHARNEYLRRRRKGLVGDAGLEPATSAV